MNLPPPRKSFRETQFELREEAILDATNRLLGDKGYEAMSMDDIAAEVGIAKGSLYRHFSSKESLAAAALCRLMRATLAVINGQPESEPAVDRLKAILRWTLERRLQGQVPHLPSTSVALQRSLMLNLGYVRLVMKLNSSFRSLIERAQADGALDRSLPADVIMFTIYARSCDPTLTFLRSTRSYPDEQVVEYLVRTCFDGLNG